MYLVIFLFMQAQAASGQQTGLQTDDQQRELAALVTKEVAEAYPDILQMLFVTPSLNFEEKKYWIQLLPLMSIEHVERLRTILVTERQKLATIEEQFTEKAEIFSNTVKLSREEIEQRRETLRTKEVQSQQQETDEEADLLNQLDMLSDE